MYTFTFWEKLTKKSHGCLIPEPTSGQIIHIDHVDMEGFKRRALSENQIEFLSAHLGYRETAQVAAFGHQRGENGADHAFHFGEKPIDETRQVIPVFAEGLPDVEMRQSGRFGLGIAHSFEKVGRVFSQMDACHSHPDGKEIFNVEARV